MLIRMRIGMGVRMMRVRIRMNGDMGGKAEDGGFLEK